LGVLSTIAAEPTIAFLQLVDWVYEQRIPPWQPYFGLLDKIHQYLAPRTYAEIGVSLGRSLTLTLPGTVSVGIDPAPNLQFPMRRSTRIFTQTSDDFFDQHDLRALFGGLPLDLGFIDGMHQFEFALRDFINFEQASASGTVILIHDCLPVDELSADREQRTTIWSGDIWRLILLLREWRPDLDISVVDIAPTGLGVVRGLDPTSTALTDNYETIIQQYASMPFNVLEKNKHERLGAVGCDWNTVQSLLPAEPFRVSSVGVLKARRALCGVKPLAYRSARYISSKVGRGTPARQT
jgi:hypothetical protein